MMVKMVIRQFINVIAIPFLASVADKVDESQVELSRSETTLDKNPLKLRVEEGKNVTLPCSVNNLNQYKVLWFDKLGVLQFILESRFTKDSRKYLTRPYTNDWNLHITEVQDDDRGNYRCLINTRPVQFRNIFLEVLVSPRINLNSSSSDQKVRTWTDLILFCDVSGYPTPNVTWFYSELEQADIRPLNMSGNEITIENVTSPDSGLYTCTADNKIGESNSHTVQVIVADMGNAAPMLQMLLNMYLQTTLPVTNLFWLPTVQRIIV